MAWQAYTSDVLVNLPAVTCGGYCNISGRLAYRLYCDDSDLDNVKIRIEVTYFHIRASLDVDIEEPGGGYYNAASISWFLGAYPLMFNQAQYDLNSQRTPEGGYVNQFAWPYNAKHTVTFYEEVLPTRWQNAIYDTNSVVYSGLPVFALSLIDDVRNFGGIAMDYGRSVENISVNPLLFCWGQAFSDKSKFNGINTNGQSKVYVTPITVDFATSATKSKSTGQSLSYDNELNTPVSNLAVVSPYTSSNCFAYVELSKSDLDKMGLIQYDPALVGSADYILDGYVVPFTWWSRARNSVLEPLYYSTLERWSSSEQKVTLKYEGFDMPEYDPPEPVGDIEDNTVFRLRRQYDSSGHVIVDQNGNPRLAWVKCARIGQE